MFCEKNLNLIDWWESMEMFEKFLGKVWIFVKKIMIEKGLKMLKMLKNTANFGQKNGPLGMWVEKNNSTNFLN